MAEKFEEIAAEFQKRVSTIVWCTMTTVDRKGRPRTRIVHPIWEGTTGWVLTGRESLKAKHLAKNPFVSVSYWSLEHGLVVADCECSWEESTKEQERVFKLFQATPPPYGYDPEMLGMKSGAPGIGYLRFKPWRVELHSLADVMQGKPAQVWKAE